MNPLLLAKTFLLLAPIAWFVFTGPSPYRVFLLGSIFALFEMFRLRSLRLLWSAWVIPLMVAVYLFAGAVAPAIDADLQSFDARMAVVTVCYGVPAGFCLGLWCRKEPQSVLMAFILFTLTLTLGALTLIHTVGVDKIITMTEYESSRKNPDQASTFLGVFKPENIIIGIIPMTLFALGSLPLVCLPKQKLPKAFLIGAATVGTYVNIAVATRTTIVASAISFVCIIALLCGTGVVKVSRIAVILSLILGIGLMCLSVVNLDLLTVAERLSKMGYDSRFDLWSQSIKLILDNPLGAGKEHPFAIWAHNLFLDFGLTNGLLGMAAMTILFGFIFNSVKKLVRRSNNLSQPCVLVLVSSFGVCFLVQLTMPPSPALIAFSYLVCGFCLEIEREKQWPSPDWERKEARRSKISIKMLASRDQHETTSQLIPAGTVE